jgi:hypothetical protein
MDVDKIWNLAKSVTVEWLSRVKTAALGLLKLWDFLPREQAPNY